MKKTLGGQRLGSGNKMEVDIKGFERSTHDLSYLWRSTMAAGTLVPFMNEVALPGDTFDIDLNTDIKTHPTIGPLFGSYKVQLDVFFCPIRLYQAQLHNNKLKIGMNMSSVKLPVMKLKATKTPAGTADLDNAQINPSCILSYLGIRGVGVNDTGLDECYRYFNAVPLLQYWDIYKNYYANKMEEVGAVINTPLPTIVTSVNSVFVEQSGGAPDIGLSQYPTATVPAPHVAHNTKIKFNYTATPPAPETLNLYTADGQIIPIVQCLTNITTDTTGLVVYGFWNGLKYGLQTLKYWNYVQPGTLPGVRPQVQTFPLDNIDGMREYLMSQVSNTSPIDIQSPDLDPYALLLALPTPTNQFTLYMQNQQGLAIKTYQSDMLNNWVSTEWIDGAGGINEITAVDVSSGELKIDALILARKTYDMLMKIAVSGGSFDDWSETVYDHPTFGKPETPVYQGGLIKELIFQEVVSNSQANGDEGTQPLGTLAGKGVMSNKHKGGQIHVKVNEIGYIMGIISLTPRIDNSQGNKWDVHLQTMDDFHKPDLDEIGFQELITEQMAWWDTTANSNGSGNIGNFVQKSAGKQPAWMNYMTNINQTRGNFAIRDNEMFMTLNRRYEPVSTTGGIKDLTTYIDPSKFNNIFAETAIDAQNFWAQISVNITARRKMSAKIMPNL